MATMTLTRRRKRMPEFSSGDNGMLLTPQEFDRADFEDGWRYELINGVLIVSPIPSEQERDPNEELGALLRWYRRTHPKGGTLNRTLFEHTVIAGRNRRRADRVIWAGLGRMPRPRELPTIIVEFVSKRKRDRLLDYETKRDEFIEAGVKEYWVIDRFQRTVTVFSKSQGKVHKKVIQARHTCRTELLPGFEFRPADLFAVADDWAETSDDDESDA